MQFRWRYLQVFAIALSLFMIVGCEVEDPNAPVAYGANGVEAPRAYTVKSVAPKSMGYPAFAMIDVPVGKPPVLPKLERTVPQGQPWQGLHDPLKQGVNPDLVTSRPFPVAGLNPQQPMPVEQKVYGGAYGDERRNTPYLHMVGDKVKINVKNQPEFAGEVEILADGTLQIPGTEDFVEAKGRDVKQIQLAVARAIRPYVRKAPVVRVSTADAQGGYYTILGGVNNQGRFPIGREPITLSEAVFRADSTLLQKAKTINTLGNDKARQEFTRKGGSWLGEVVLVTPHRTMPTARKYNVAEALYGGLGEQDPLIEPGQIIIVRDRADKALEMHIQRLLLRDNMQGLTVVPKYVEKKAPNNQVVVVNNMDRPVPQLTEEQKEKLRNLPKKKQKKGFNKIFGALVALLLM